MSYMTVWIYRPGPATEPQYLPFEHKTDILVPEIDSCHTTIRYDLDLV